MVNALKLLTHETLDLELECRQAQAGRFYHWNRTYLIRKDGEIYSIALNIFQRIAKVFVELFNGNYFCRFFKIEVLKLDDIQAMVSEASQRSKLLEQLSEEGARKRTEIRTREKILPDANSGLKMCGSGRYENLADHGRYDPDIALVTLDESSRLLEAARKCNRARQEMGTSGDCHLWTWNHINGKYHRIGDSEEITATELVDKYSVMLFLSIVGNSGRRMDFSFDGAFPSFSKVLHERALGDQSFEFASVFVENGFVDDGKVEFKCSPYILDKDERGSKENPIGYERFVIPDFKNLPHVLKHMRFQVKI